ncbi:hypothetical protein PQQ95_02715 [Paraburkholderia caffeinilytica]
MCFPLPLMVTVYGRRFQPAGLIPHDLPLVYCKAHAMQSFRLEVRVLRAVTRRCALSVMRNGGATLVQEQGARLVQVRAAPQRSVSIGQRAWAVHNRRPFVQAQAAKWTLHGVSGGLPKAFEAAMKIARHMPGDLRHLSFVNSGSDVIDIALKIALACGRRIGNRAGHSLGLERQKASDLRRWPFVLPLCFRRSIRRR